MKTPPSAQLTRIYKSLLQHFGPQHWWPGETRFEIIVGAILTQNTNWENVTKAIRNLKGSGLLTPLAMRKVSRARLAQKIRPSGYYNIKARRLKHFVGFLFSQYQGSLRKMAGVPWETLRPKLLAVNGIGPETADSILLYAFGKPVFVVDAYTKRFLSRHKRLSSENDYHDIQAFFMRHLKRDTRLFNEYHALLVRLGKDYCRPVPRCILCPLRELSRRT